jgi:hypothetical protein
MQPVQDHVAAFGMLPDVVHRRDIRAAPTIGAREQTNWNLVHVCRRRALQDADLAISVQNAGS